MSDQVRIKRALISVSDKTDIIPFARALAGMGVEIVSTGGTAKTLLEAGVAVIPIDQVTGLPEMLSGRVKTLHPAVHGGLLAVRNSPEHVAALAAHKITPIDLVCINLYPFQQTVSKPGVSHEEAVEQVDIGGPSMVRSGAKNHAWVTVVTSPKMYDRVIAEMTAHEGATTLVLRTQLAAAAFAMTAEYDAAIAGYMERSAKTAMPSVLRLSYVRAEDLRYGENPHQAASLYKDQAYTGPSVVTAEKLHGKELSYNNINDAAAALQAVRAMATLHLAAGPLADPAGASRVGAVLAGLSAMPVAACVVKHANPCGAAVAASAAEAVDRAIAGDPLAAFGGILACSARIDKAAAMRLCGKDIFLEVILAPAFEPDALAMLRERWTNCRLLAAGAMTVTEGRGMEFRSIPGGLLAQERDTKPAEPEAWAHKAGPKAPAETLRAAAVLETIVRFMTSNSVAIGGAEGGAVRLFGGGLGQVDRVTACRIACEKAGKLAAGAIAVSDGFFPFPDGPEVLIKAGVKTIIQPGGSKRDDETFALCEKHGMTCLVTGTRRFKH